MHAMFIAETCTTKRILRDPETLSSSAWASCPAASAETVLAALDNVLSGSAAREPPKGILLRATPKKKPSKKSRQRGKAVAKYAERPEKPEVQKNEARIRKRPAASEVNVRMAAPKFPRFPGILPEGARMEPMTVKDYRIYTSGGKWRVLKKGQNVDKSFK